MKGICSNKTTSNNLISNSHHELKWIDGHIERALKEELIHLGFYMA